MLTTLCLLLTLPGITQPTDPATCIPDSVVFYAEARHPSELASKVRDSQTFQTLSQRLPGEVAAA